MKIPTGTLVAAMDGRKMLLMRNEGDATKPRLETILQEEDRNPKTSLQGTDRPGRSFSSASPRRSAYSDTDWHDEAETAFIISATEKLDQACRDCDAGVIVFAAPSALGDFRKHRTSSLGNRIIAEIAKDMVNSSQADITEAIAALER